MKANWMATVPFFSRWRVDPARPADKLAPQKTQREADQRTQLQRELGLTVRQVLGLKEDFFFFLLTRRRAKLPVAC